MKEVRLFIEDEEIELNDSVQFAITKQFKDLSQPSVVLNDWSKTVSIPFTPHNNYVFGHIYDPLRKNSVQKVANNVLEDALVTKSEWSGTTPNAFNDYTARLEGSDNVYVPTEGSLGGIQFLFLYKDNGVEKQDIVKAIDVSESTINKRMYGQIRLFKLTGHTYSDFRVQLRVWGYKISGSGQKSPYVPTLTFKLPDLDVPSTYKLGFTPKSVICRNEGDEQLVNICFTQMTLTKGVTEYRWETLYNPVGIYFDPYKKFNFKLLWNDVLFMSGYGKMNSTSKQENKGSYNITLNGQLGNILQEMNKITFNSALYTGTEKDTYFFPATDYLYGSLTKDLVWNSWNNVYNQTDEKPKKVTDSTYTLNKVLGFAVNNSYDDMIDSTSIETIDENSKIKTTTFKELLGVREIGGQSYEEKTNTSIDSTITDKGLLPRSFGEYRSYLQSPYIFFDKYFKIFAERVYEKFDYKTIFDESWFNWENPYWSKLVMMLKRATDKSNESRVSLAFGFDNIGIGTKIVDSNFKYVYNSYYDSAEEEPNRYLIPSSHKSNDADHAYSTGNDNRTETEQHYKASDTYTLNVVPVDMGKELATGDLKVTYGDDGYFQLAENTTLQITQPILVDYVVNFISQYETVEEDGTITTHKIWENGVNDLSEWGTLQLAGTNRAAIPAKANHHAGHIVAKVHFKKNPNDEDDVYTKEILFYTDTSAGGLARTYDKEFYESHYYKDPDNKIPYDLYSEMICEQDYNPNYIIGGVCDDDGELKIGGSKGSKIYKTDNNILRKHRMHMSIDLSDIKVLSKDLGSNRRLYVSIEFGMNTVYVTNLEGASIPYPDGDRYGRSFGNFTWTHKDTHRINIYNIFTNNQDGGDNLKSAISNFGYNEYFESLYDQTETEVTITLGSNYNRTGTILRLYDLWDNSYTPFSVILNYCKMFNILIKVDDVNKEIHYIPYSTYFKDYTIEDWTDKLDTSKEVTVKPLTFDKHNVLFNYENGKTELGLKYKEKFSFNVGEKNIVTDYNFNNDTEKLFSKVQYSMTESQSSIDWYKLYNEFNYAFYLRNEILPHSNDKDKKYVGQFGQFYFYNGISQWDELKDAGGVPVESVYISDDTNTQSQSTVFTYIDYNHLSTFGNFLKETNSYSKLNIISGNKKGQVCCLFNIPSEQYTVGESYAGVKGIYDLCWTNIINEIYSRQSKLVTCYLKLRPQDMINFEFNHFVLINNVLYMINKIYDYDITSSGSTKVDLVKINNIDGYTKAVWEDYFNSDGE